MKIKSVYEHMERAAEEAGCQNVKIFLRHSIRGHIDNPKNSEKVLLTAEGRALAHFLGKNIEGKIGFVSSSPVERCRQTLECIFEGMGIQHEIQAEKKALSEPQIKDERAAFRTFKSYKYDAGKMFYDLKHGKKLSGMHSLEYSVKTMLDYIFAHGGESGTLDLYCSHDFMLVLLLCAMFDYPEKNKSLDGDEWPCMLEGMVFCGTRRNFTASWRGVAKTFCDYLVNEIPE